MEMAQIILRKEERLGWIKLQSPVMSPEFITEFLAVLADLEADENIRVILIEGGNEKIFFAGYNLALFQQEQATMANIKGNILETQRVINSVEECRKPVIALVCGHAMGAGFELVLACDIIVASEKAKFGFPEVKVGILPAAGGTMRLPRSAGKCRAMEMILTGDRYPARALLEMGLINRVVEADQVNQIGQEMAEQIAANAPRAVRAAKRVTIYWEALLNKQVELYTLEKTLDCLLSEDLQEGVKAFLEKRPADFKDR